MQIGAVEARASAARPARTGLSSCGAHTAPVRTRIRQMEENLHGILQLKGKSLRSIPLNGEALETGRLDLEATNIDIKLDATSIQIFSIVAVAPG